MPERGRFCWITSTVKTVCATRNIVRQVLTNGSALAGKKHSPVLQKLMKADRDANFIEKNEQGRNGKPLAFYRYAVCLRCQQRNPDADPEICPLPRDAGGRLTRRALTRTNGSKSCSNIWSRCDDQPLGGYQNANVVMVMGGNAAEAHPVGFRWAMEAKTTTMQP